MSCQASGDDEVWAGRTHAGRRVPRAWVRLLAAHAAVTRELDAAMRAGHGLTLTDYEALLHLSWAPQGCLSRAELARGVLLTQGGVTRMIGGLEAAGLVESAPSTADRRLLHTALTEAGRAKLEAAAADLVEAVDRLFTERFALDELRAPAALLGRLP